MSSTTSNPTYDWTRDPKVNQTDPVPGFLVALANLVESHVRGPHCLRARARATQEILANPHRQTLSSVT